MVTYKNGKNECWCYRSRGQRLGFVQGKKAMIRSSARSAILCIGEKLNSVQKMKICGLNAIDYLVTDLRSTDPKVKVYEGHTKII